MADLSVQVVVGGLRLGAVGATIQIAVVDMARAVKNISTATLTSNVFLRSPGNRVVIKTPTFVTNGSDGLLLVTTVAGDLSEKGPWLGEYKCVIGGVTLPSTFFAFNVEGTLYP